MREDIRLALRNTKHPRDWFDDPNNATGLAHDWYEWNHLTAYGTVPPPYLGRRSATQINDSKRAGMTLFLDTNAGANLVWEALRSWQVMPVRQGLPGFATSWGNPWFFSMRLNQSNLVGASTGEKHQGIFWGDSWGINTPWQSNPAGFQGQARVSLYWDYTDEKWRVSLMDTDGNAPDVIDCVIQPSFEIDLGITELSMMWVPPPIEAPESESRLVAMLDGVVALDLMDHPRCNAISAASNTTGPGIFFTHGSDAASRASEAGFYQGRIWAPLPLPAR